MCRSTCTDPYVIVDTALCVLAISEADVQQAKAISGVMGTAGSSMSAAAGTASVFNFRGPDSFCLIASMKMLSSAKYLKIKFPAKLQAIFNNQTTDTFIAKLVPGVKKTIEHSFTNSKLPADYQNFRLASSFVVNIWQSLVPLIILMCGIVIVFTASICCKRYKVNSKVLEKLDEVLRWNLFLSFFITFYDQIVLYTSLELRTTDFDQLLSILSFLLCVAANIFSLGVLFKITKAINTALPSKRLAYSSQDAQQLKSFEKQWARYQALLVRFKHSSFLQQAFIPIFIIRIYAVNIILGYMTNYPLPQIALITLLNILMLLYLAICDLFRAK